MLNPYLGGDEQFAAIDATIANTLADLGFVHIGLRCVNMTVPDFDGI